MDLSEKYTSGEYYHIFNRNLDTLRVFKNRENCDRFINLIKFYQYKSTPCAFSEALAYMKTWQISVDEFMADVDKKDNKLIDVIAYCIMPNHFHLLLHQIKDGGISLFLNNALNGFTRFYNIKNERKGPIWIGPSKNVHIQNDEHLWEESRYIHRNPLKAGLVKKPSDWIYSSYREYLNLIPPEHSICAPSFILDTIEVDYKSFVEDWAAE